MGRNIVKGFVLLSIPKSGLFVKDGELVSGDGVRVSTESDSMYVQMLPTREDAEARDRMLRKKFKRAMMKSDTLIIKAECAVQPATE